jgi:nucleotide-binding universal stress UspA family protein
MVPVDLAHEDKLGRTLKCAAQFARQWDAKVTYIGVASSAPSAVAHNPEEYKERLARFAAAQGELEGIETSSYGIISPDPTVDVHKSLLTAIDDIGGDLVVMESHLPRVSDYIWASHGGYVAEHAKITVMLVRGA